MAKEDFLFKSSGKLMNCKKMCQENIVKFRKSRTVPWFFWMSFGAKIFCSVECVRFCFYNKCLVTEKFLEEEAVRAIFFSKLSFQGHQKYTHHMIVAL